MKTPREILLNRHRAAESRLDAIRRVAVAAAGVDPTMPAGELTAKKTPGCNDAAAIRAMMATKLSSSIEP